MTTLDEWRAYLADSLKPLVTHNTLEAQKEFARYQTGGRILEMEEHLESTDLQLLLIERGITPAMRSDYKRRFLTEAREHVESEARWRKEHNLD